MNRPDPDPLRALDSVEPPSQWDDILQRAEHADDLVLATGSAPAPSRGSRRLLVAAVVAAILGLAGVVAVSAGGGGTPGGVADRPEASTAPPGGTDSPSGSVRTGPSTTSVDGGTTPDGSTITGGPGATTPDGSTIPGDGGGTTPDGNTIPGTTPDGDPTTTVKPGDQPTTTVEPGDQPTTTVTTAPTTTAVTTTTSGSVGTAPPEAIWGRTWTVTALSGDGGSRSLGSRGLQLKASSNGSVSILVCNLVSGSASVADGRLSVSLNPAGTDNTCGEPLDGNEPIVIALLSSNPTISISGNTLTLAGGGAKLVATS